MPVTLRIATDCGDFYPVLIGEGVVERLPGEVPAACGAVALIADSNLTRLHATRVRDAIGTSRRTIDLEFPAGERNKNRRTKEQLEDSMICAGLGRDCAVVALGGGVTTDLAGYVAGTFMRGVPWVALPTSLLAAVDASVGGKTGVNTETGKNLIGVFHQPRAVLIDLALVSTLPHGEIDNGLAEMAKHAVIADRSYLRALVESAERLRGLEPVVLEEAIRRSIEIKGAVVAADTAERDYRQVLNLGHTIGHAIETVSEYRVSHGRAVSVGISVECCIAARLGLISDSAVAEIRESLVRLGLPIAPPSETDPGDLLEATRRDKKGRAGQARYALPAAIGEMARSAEGFARTVPDDVVLTAVSEA
jgi:3-dehydroquinate synthase